MNQVKKGLTGTLCLFMLWGTLPEARAQEIAQEAQGPMMKLTRGAINFATAPLEYFVQWGYLAHERRQNPSVSLVGGALYGTCFMAARFVTGALEVATFPLPVPENYESIMDPATALDAMKDVK